MRGNQRDHWPSDSGIDYLPANLLWLFLCFGRRPALELLYRREGWRGRRRCSACGQLCG